MTTKTLTLTRWHHVAERLNAKLKELEANVRAVFASTAVSAFQGDEQVASLEKRRDHALASVKLARQLVTTVGTIREALAKANAQHGVSEQLSRLDALNREIRLLSTFAAVDNDNKIQIGHLESHFATLNAAENRTRGTVSVSVALLPESQQDAWIAERDALQAQAHALSDSINDLNHQKLTLDLSDDVARIAGV